MTIIIITIIIKIKIIKVINIFHTSSLSEMYFLSKMSEDNLEAKSHHHALISFVLAMQRSFSLQDNAICAN